MKVWTFINSHQNNDSTSCRQHVNVCEEFFKQLLFVIKKKTPPWVERRKENVQVMSGFTGFNENLIQLSIWDWKRCHRDIIQNGSHKSDITFTDVFHCHSSKGNLKIISGLSEDDKIVLSRKTWWRVERGGQSRGLKSIKTYSSWRIQMYKLEKHQQPKERFG